MKTLITAATVAVITLGGSLFVLGLLDALDTAEFAE